MVPIGQDPRGARFVKILLVAVGAVIALVVVGSMAVDEGEVVTLTTRDEGGATYDTQLWVVDLDGRLYLRSASPDAGWLLRLRERPEVVLERHEEKLAFHAVLLDGGETAAAVNRAMAAKYGATDRFYSRLFPRDRAVVVRLEPVEASGALAGEHAGAQAPATP
jgi:hypothetical protein